LRAGGRDQLSLGCPVGIDGRLFSAAQSTVRCIDLLDERVVDHWSLLSSLAVSLMPIRTSRAAIYAPVRQHHCPT
jgi:hypothetical protein